MGQQQEFEEKTAAKAAEAVIIIDADVVMAVETDQNQSSTGDNDVGAWSPASNDSFNPEEMFGSGVYMDDDEDGGVSDSASHESRESLESEASSEEMDSASAAASPLHLQGSEEDEDGQEEDEDHEKSTNNFFSSADLGSIGNKNSNGVVYPAERRMSAAAAP